MGLGSRTNNIDQRNTTPGTYEDMMDCEPGPSAWNGAQPKGVNNSYVYCPPYQQLYLVTSNSGLPPVSNGSFYMQPVPYYSPPGPYSQRAVPYRPTSAQVLQSSRTIATQCGPDQEQPRHRSQVDAGRSVPPTAPSYHRASPEAFDSSGRQRRGHLMCFTKPKKKDYYGSTNALSDTTASSYHTASSKPVEADVPPKTFFDMVDKLLDSPDDLSKEKAYYLLRDRRDVWGNSAGFLWRLARASFFYAQILGNKGHMEKKKACDFEARDIAYEALDIDPNSPDVHTWCAVTLGNLGDYQTIQDKIRDGYKFKEHIDIAVKMKPNDPLLHHMIGRWCYSVAMLSWIERKIAATFYASPPTATISEAKQHFLNADRLEPDKWIENLLYIAKCFIAENNTLEAVHWLKKAASLPVTSPDDQKAREEVLSFLTKYDT